MLLKVVGFAITLVGSIIHSLQFLFQRNAFILKSKKEVYQRATWNYGILFFMLSFIVYHISFYCISYAFSLTLINIVIVLLIINYLLFTRPVSYEGTNHSFYFLAGFCIFSTISSPPRQSIITNTNPNMYPDSMKYLLITLVLFVFVSFRVKYFSHIVVGLSFSLCQGFSYALAHTVMASGMIIRKDESFRVAIYIIICLSAYLLGGYRSLSNSPTSYSVLFTYISFCIQGLFLVFRVFNEFQNHFELRKSVFIISQLGCMISNFFIFKNVWPVNYSDSDIIDRNPELVAFLSGQKKGSSQGDCGAK